MDVTDADGRHRGWADRVAMSLRCGCRAWRMRTWQCEVGSCSRSPPSRCRPQWPWRPTWSFAAGVNDCLRSGSTSQRRARPSSAQCAACAAADPMSCCSPSGTRRVGWP
jgi:hypothetical protein